MIKPQYKDVYSDPTWEMYECDKGARWTAVKGGTCTSKDKDECYFSGCPGGTRHQLHLKGETKDRDKAHDWFRRPEDSV